MTLTYEEKLFLILLLLNFLVAIIYLLAGIFVIVPATAGRLLWQVTLRA